MQGLFDFFNRRDARRMNVVNARTDFGLEILFFEFVKNFEIWTRGLKWNDVGIHVIDCRNNVVKLAVAHMRMNLGFRLDAAMYQTEGRDCPVKIFALPIRTSQRKLFTQSGFIDLNDANTVFLKIQNFFSDCQSKLQSWFFDADVFARKRPV